MCQWYTSQSPLIPSQGIPLNLLDLFQSYDPTCHHLLRSTKLFLSDIINTDTPPVISTHQLVTLIGNATNLTNTPDTAFLIGQRFFNSDSGPANAVLLNSPNLYIALETLQRFQPLLSPLMTLKFFHDEQDCFIFWRDDSGSHKLNTKLVEIMTVALVSYCKRQFGQHPPWKIYFNYRAPNHLEQYWLHIGENLYFNTAICAMRIPKEYLFKQWREESLSYTLRKTQAEAQLSLLPAQQSLISRVNCVIATGLQTGDKRYMQLETVAEALKISSATLKRHLKSYNTSYQKLLDQERLYQAVYLMHKEKLTQSAIAEKLGFHDNSSYRRSLKRLTGILPSELGLI